ncbi:class I SAM-dependent methyltransferase [Oryzomicrobium sp.]|uniref:class I SAM-dependent methyltransferase n=1 Tax=Oryzomicrobium sp. TaxID=1911578 RepID=UPI002FE21CCE
MPTTAPFSSACPCCSQHGCTDGMAPGWQRCELCRHHWTHPAEDSGIARYSQLQQRNNTATPKFERKIGDRLHSIAPLLRPGLRVLEIGCAEGTLGERIKALCDLSYDGIEISHDAEAAAMRLDQVFRTPATALSANGYELILSFHVLEHIANVNTEVQAWHRCLAENGQLIVEVPNGAGHPLLSHDHNTEHLHQFSTSSLVVLLSRHGFEPLSVTTGHYESAVYSDSIRVHARKTLSPSNRIERLLERFHAVLPTPFLAYGIGGDFTNYILPLIDHLPVISLLDSSPKKWGMQIAGHSVGPYDSSHHGNAPLLICSIRFRQEIEQHLQSKGIAPARIRTLDDIYDPA